MHRRDDAEPAIGKGVVVDHGRVIDHAGVHRNHGEKEDDDGKAGDGRDNEVEGQRRKYTAIVEPGQEHDGEDNERFVPHSFYARHSGNRLHEIAERYGVAGFEHGVSHDEEQADVKGHERPYNVLGLRVLAAGGRDSGCHLRVDHGDACVEKPCEPAGDQSGKRAAFADGKVPAHEFADEHDADAKRPHVARTEYAKQRDFFAMNGG